MTSAGYGYSIGRASSTATCRRTAVEGTPLEIEYFDERIAATVAAEPLWDPKGERLKG